ncbi:hypothetical protein FD754_019253, partial [Muntiacus muntjak]
CVHGAHSFKQTTHALRSVLNNSASGFYRFLECSFKDTTVSFKTGTDATFRIIQSVKFRGYKARPDSYFFHNIAYIGEKMSMYVHITFYIYCATLPPPTNTPNNCTPLEANTYGAFHLHYIYLSKCKESCIPLHGYIVFYLSSYIYQLIGGLFPLLGIKKLKNNNNNKKLESTDKCFPGARNSVTQSCHTLCMFSSDKYLGAEVEDSDCEDFPNGPLEDDFDANDEADCQDEVIPLGDGDIWTLCPLLSMKPGEYSYFSPRTMSMWAGPDHWRFRPRHKRDTASQSEHRKKSSKDFKIDFDDDIDFDVHFQKTKAVTVLTKFTLENQSWRATTLPTDFQYETKDLVQLHLKPGTRLLKVAQGQKAGTEHYEEIGDYDYNNPNDTSNFCPGLQAADSDYEESDDLFVGPAGTLKHSDHPSATTQDNGEASEVHGPYITTYGESNLVAEPQKVNKIEIQYAKTAKKMDVKRLKQSMWSLVTEIPKQADAEVNHSENGEAGPFEEGADKKLSSLTKDLQKSLPPLMAQNLSIPLAFACLLHLANEKNLKLEGTKDLSDVLVRQEDRARGGGPRSHSDQDAHTWG